MVYKPADTEQANDETVSATDDTVNKAQPITRDIVNPFAQPEQSTANSTAAVQRAPIASNIPSAIPHQAANAARVTEAAANAVVGAATAMSAAATSEAVSNAAAAGLAAANISAQQSTAKAQTERQPQPVTQQAKPVQQPTQRPLVPHQQLKSATPVKGLHMIVEAKTAAEGLGIAVDELKNIHEEKNIDHASIKTSADKLNKNGITEAILAKVSGKDLEREGYQSLKNHFLRDGDTLIVKSLDRLSRRKIDIKKELEYFREHHIRIKILDIPTTMVELPDEQDWIFEMINNILIEVLASIAEQERITTKRRQSEGIAIAKEAGKHLGRPMIDFPPNWNQFYPEWTSGTITAVAAMRQLGLKRSTFYRLVKQQEEKHETEE